METLLAVQPDDMTGKHRNGEQNPLERAQSSEDEDKMVADGTPHVNQKSNFVFQAEVWIDLEPSQVDGRHFERLPVGHPYSRRLRRDIGNSNNSTDHRSSGCEITDRPASAKDDVDRAKQIV